MSTSPTRKCRTVKKGSGSVSSNEETRLTWASDCDSDMNFERDRGERRTATTDCNDGRGWGIIYGKWLSWSCIPKMRNPDTTGGLAVIPPRCKQHWITGRLSSRLRRLKRGYQRNGGRDGRRLVNTGTQNQSNRVRRVRRS
jgi:hypothetical protein